MMEEYIVEAIQGWRFNLREERKEYFIKWQNYDETENTWEPEENLNCPDILKKYIASLSPQQSRYFHCTQPEKLQGFQRNAEFLECVGIDGPHDSDNEESTKRDKQKFYCLVTFDDSDFAEEVTFREFFTYQPEAAAEFCEQRLVVGLSRPS